MQNLKNIIEKNNLAFPSIVLLLAIIISSFMLVGAINNLTNKGQAITVTGSAERLVESDTANWTVALYSRAYGPTATTVATQNVDKQKEALLNFLKKNGIEENKISTSANNQAPICVLNKDGYENCSLGQTGQTVSVYVSVESSDVYKIDKLTKDISSVDGLEVQSSSVRYLYNKLASIRKEMLAEATSNAKERADAVARAGGARVSKIVSLSSGVFQVTAKNEISAEDYGSYDISTIDKKITATVRADFSLR
jgi:uncharacterized protein